MNPNNDSAIGKSEYVKSQESNCDMDTLEIVLAIVRSVARDHRLSVTISADTNLLLEADIDSLAMLDIVQALERHYNVRLFDNLSDYSEIDTPQKMANLMNAWPR
jgi:acyl carrier protein